MPAADKIGPLVSSIGALLKPLGFRKKGMTF